MQQHPVLVLFHSGGDLEQRQHDGTGLSQRQRRALQSKMAELLVQDIGPRRQQQAREVGEEA